MISISDGIRKWCDLCCGGFVSKEDCDELREVADRIDRETVELPKDAEGVPIHVGDTVYGCSSGYITNTTVTHDLPDSWERIADELDEMVDAACSADDRCKKLADLAERIRKLAKREGE